MLEEMLSGNGVESDMVCKFLIQKLNTLYWRKKLNLRPIKLPAFSYENLDILNSLLNEFIRKIFETAGFSYLSAFIYYDNYEDCQMDEENCNADGFMNEEEFYSINPELTEDDYTSLNDLLSDLGDYYDVGGCHSPEYYSIRFSSFTGWQELFNEGMLFFPSLNSYAASSECGGVVVIKFCLLPFYLMADGVHYYEVSACLSHNCDFTHLGDFIKMCEAFFSHRVE